MFLRVKTGARATNCDAASNHWMALSLILGLLWPALPGRANAETKVQHQIVESYGKLPMSFSRERLHACSARIAGAS